VRPEYRGLGIGAYLLEHIKARAAEHLAEQGRDGTLRLQPEILAGQEAGHRLVERYAYRRVRHCWSMRIERHAPLPAPTWPEGVGLVPFDAMRDARTTYDAMAEAFRDHWQSISLS
jgi:hypothetical protein